MPHKRRRQIRVPDTVHIFVELLDKRSPPQTSRPAHSYTPATDTQSGHATRPCIPAHRVLKRTTDMATVRWVGPRVGSFPEELIEYMRGISGGRASSSASSGGLQERKRTSRSRMDGWCSETSCA